MNSMVKDTKVWTFKGKELAKEHPNISKAQGKARDHLI
jgi:hypothetical protein